MFPSKWSPISDIWKISAYLQGTTLEGGNTHGCPSKVSEYSEGLDKSKINVVGVMGYFHGFSLLVLPKSL